MVAADPADARRRRTEIANLLAARPARHLGDRLGRALLALDSDAPDSVDDVVAAAQEALRLGDLVLSERLASSALERTERFDARLALSYALAWQGRGREADSVLAAVDAGALSEEQVMAWALPRAANQFWMLSEPERATAFLQNTRKRVSTTAARLTLDALSATFAMNAGNVAPGGRRSPPTCWPLRRPRTWRWPGRPARRRCPRRGWGGSTRSRRWRTGRWAPSTRACCGSPSGWRRPRRC